MSAAEEIQFVQAIPANGDVTHAVKVSEEPWMYPESRHMRYLQGRAACGVRGRDSWGVGGMRAVSDTSGGLVPFDVHNIPEPKVGWNGEAVNVVCPRCVSKVRRAINGGTR